MCRLIVNFTSPATVSSLLQTPGNAFVAAGFANLATAANPLPPQPPRPLPGLWNDKKVAAGIVVIFVLIAIFVVIGCLVHKQRAASGSKPIEPVDSPPLLPEITVALPAADAPNTELREMHRRRLPTQTLCAEPYPGYSAMNAVHDSDDDLL